jgi:hypothetical protein
MDGWMDRWIDGGESGRRYGRDPDKLFCFSLSL